MSKSNEAFWWSLFSAGGVLTALFVPGLIVVTGLLLPTADPDTAAGRYRQISDLLGWWPVRMVVFAVIFLALFHCAHRIRHTLMDIGFRHLDRSLMIVCYVTALAGTILAGHALARLG